MYKAEILADSLSPSGDRLTTMKITFPRIMLAEFNTHRMFSRNSASSRAIPFNKMVKMVEKNPFIPIAWQKSHSGMQGSEYITDKDDIKRCIHYWIKSKNQAIENAAYLNNIGATKQLCNRLLEPFMWHTVIVSATEFSNFFELRCPKYAFSQSHDRIDYYKSKKDFIKAVKNYDADEEVPETDLEWLQINHSQADIHIQAIAELMWDAMNESTPKQLEAGQWHIPNFGHEWDNNKLRSLLLSGNYNNENDITPDINELKIKISTAHNARISYTTLGDNPKIDYEADIKLHDILLESKHFSPFEHVARVMSEEEYLQHANGTLSYEEIIEDDNFDTTIFYSGVDKNNHSVGWFRNFRGFIQYRSLIDQ